MNGSSVNRVTAGTAAIIPIHDGSIPIAFSQTGKNGRWVPTQAERRAVKQAQPRRELPGAA